MSQSNDDRATKLQPSADATADARLATDAANDPLLGAQEQDGIVVVLTGEGKGKSTSAFGMIVRALGWGQRVGVVQFMPGDWETGERRFLARQPGLDWRVTGEGTDTDDPAAGVQAAMEGFAHAAALMSSGEVQLVILDEVNWAMAQGTLDPAAVMQAIEGRAKGCTVILTGRHAPESVLGGADLITSMENLRHPHAEGRAPLRGVEY